MRTESQRPYRLFLVTSLIIVTTACVGPQVASSERSLQSTIRAPQSPKRVTTVIRGIPTSMAETRTNFSISNMPGLESIDELVHAGLTQADHQGRLWPRLAEAVPTLENGLWTVLPDGRMETTWHIRPGARWHDGAAFVSTDLVFTAAVEQDKELALPRPGDYELIEAILAPAPDVVMVTWKRPFIEANAFFSGEMGSPLPRHLLEQPFTEDKAGFLLLPYWSQEFVGAGPFKLREWALDTHVVVVANDDYVLGRPKVDEVEVRFIQDQSAVVASLMTGAIDLTMGRTLLTVEQALQISERYPDFKIQWGFDSWYRITAQFINANPPLVTDARFRRAMLHAVDRQQMADVLMGGLSKVAHSFVSPDLPEYKEVEASIVRYDYDPRRATEIIEALGYSRGADGMFYDAANQRLWVPISTSTRAEMNPKVTIPIVDSWKQLGVDAELLLIPAQRMNDRELRATYPGFEMIRGTATVNSRDMKRFHSASTPLPENRFMVTGNNPRYRNAALDSLIDRYVSTIPWRERMDTLGAIVGHMTDQLPWMGLFYDPVPTILSGRLERATGKGAVGSQAWNAHEWELKP